MENRYKIILCCLWFLIHVTSIASDECTLNEKYIENDNTLSACEQTCTNPNLRCINSTIAWTGCRCIAPAMYRNTKGECVTIEDCDAFPGECYFNEYYSNVGDSRNCEATCRVKGGNCPESEEHGCYCDDGYYRNAKGICVLEKDCESVDKPKDKPKDEASKPTCGRNQIYIKDSSLPTCEETCANPHIKCIGSNLGWEGCRCLPNHLRTKNGDCVPYRLGTEFCKYRYNEPVGKCGENEFYATNEFGKDCESTCRVLEGICDEVNQFGCYCKPGYHRNAESICVLEKECNAAVTTRLDDYSPETHNNGCGENEFYTEDASAPTCQPTCSNPELNCIVDKALGWKGCRCKPNHVRNTEGDCVRRDKCNIPVGECGSNEYYSREGDRRQCEATCRVRVGDCEPIIQDGCYCDDGHFRNAKGVCVTERYCDPEPSADLCGPNEFYSEDKDAPACEPTCSNPRLSCITNKKFGWKGCHCKRQHVRNSDGVCVHRSQCDTPPGKCGVNEFYARQEEAGRCEATCRVREGFCDDPKNQDGCYCDDGRYRNSKGICVLEHDCDSRWD